MRKMGWFLVGFLYFVLVWLNQRDPSLFGSFSILKDIAILFALFAWSFALIWACRQTWISSQVVLSPKLRRLSFAGLIALLIQYSLGAVSREFYAGLACPHFPTCANSFFPSNFESSIAFVHRWWGILMLGLFVHVAIAAVKTAPELLAPARRALGLSVAQVFLGIGVVMTQLSADSRLVHVAIGYALWGNLLFILVRTGGIKPRSANVQ
jgi:heme A synthase